MVDDTKTEGASGPQTTEAEKERIRSEEINRLRTKQEDTQKANAEKREDGEEARAQASDPSGGVHGDARPARATQFEGGPPPGSFPNVPNTGFRQNPANQKVDLPPERQAPVPPEGKAGQGRVKPHEQPVEEPKDETK